MLQVLTKIETPVCVCVCQDRGAWTILPPGDQTVLWKSLQLWQRPPNQQVQGTTRRSLSAFILVTWYVSCDQYHAVMLACPAN